MPSTPKVSRANVRKLVYPTDEEELDLIFEMWAEMSFLNVDYDTAIIAEMADAVFLHQLKRYFCDSTLSRRMHEYDYICAIVCAINARLFSLKCNCSNCNIRWHDFSNTL